MKLNPTERDSALWTKISAELEERLQTLREQNDGDKTPEDTAKLRGRISEVKTMLDWAVPDIQIT